MLHRLVQLLRILFLAAILQMPGVCFAQVAAATDDPTVALDQATSELDAVKASLASAQTAGDYDPLRARAQVVATTATAAIDALTPKLDAAQATLAAIGEAAEGEAADVQAQRAALTAQRDALDSAVKRATLLSTGARETIESINRAITDLFNRDTLERVASPLTTRYWQSVIDNLPVDLVRLSSFFGSAADRFANEASLRGALIAAMGLGLAVALLSPIRIRLRKAGQAYAADRAPQTRARRSGLAVWFLLVGSLTSSFAFVCVVQGLDWAGFLTGPAADLAWTLALASAFGSVVVSLGSAFLLVDRPSWRLLPIDDAAAVVLRPFPVATAIVVVVGTGLIELNRIVGASPAANVTANLLVALLHAGLIATLLVALRRLRSARDAEAGEVTERRSIVTVAMLLGWIAVVACLAALARGNVNLALLIGREIIWVATVTSGAYLLMTALDDLVTTVLSQDGRFGRALARSFGLRESTVRQLGLVISVIARVAIGFFALASVLAPLGGGTAPAYTQLSGISSIAIGGIVIQPGSILRAIAILALGISAVRLIGRWMNGTFLPATELDAGARNSALTIVRYIGIVLVTAWSISSLGVGIERIALLASALSVGIGFGLQAITQNFISGLILLAERPVKIGDTIRVGTDEGDVKSINVRSTEIQIGDRSTLIIPNSELITKSVRNMTLANPLGRVQIVFSVPMEEDADEIIAILMRLFADHPAILDDPAPTVMIDSLVEAKINFNAIAFVASPRLTYATRSELLLQLLRRLKARGISSEAGIRETPETSPVAASQAPAAAIP
ncbi:hypothetical protein ASG43_05235 [Aureimonas sp. Leaf454]|uniref:DUF3772 domain-containing protein n=1 Tax=Aureimonas sp. Leaf454 TaxID=1736381 RepID=UPI00070016E0|nr:DUF3772 domain-containing protein [Aureimonas sp. Leaf454]KQT50691.1 hypothetical protein ASG43_05235 [Aureimonas sp. Leaf454]